MKRSLWLALTLLLAAAPARAQTSAVLLFANGGRWWPVSDMSSETGDKFSAEWSYGGGLGWQFHDRAALRLSVNTLQTQWIGDRLFEVFPTVTDRRFNRTYFMADIQYGWPTASGVIPYIYAGGGAVYTAPKDDELESFTDFTARFGAGINILSAIGVWFLETDMAGWRLNSLDVEFHGLKIELSARVGWALVIPY